MSTYPIYRKFRDRNTWAKVISHTEVVVVHTGGPDSHHDKASLTIAANWDQRADSVNDKYTEPATRQDFEKAYGETMWKIVKTNDII